MREFMKSDEEPFGAAELVVEVDLRTAVVKEIEARLLDLRLPHDDAGAVTVLPEVILGENADVPLGRGVCKQQTSSHGGPSFMGRFGCFLITIRAWFGGGGANRCFSSNKAAR